MASMSATSSFNFIDLFAGAGGLSEGFIQAGFSPVAHVEMNPYAARTLETRTGYYYLKSQQRLDTYYDYITGRTSRADFLEQIPEELFEQCSMKVGIAICYVLNLDPFLLVLKKTEW